MTDCTKNIRFVTVYRPPPSQENGFTTSGFLSEFEDFLETVTLLQGKLLLVGDYNIHMDCIYKSEVSRFTNILSAYGLKQHVEGPTHKRGHTLDLVISNPEDNIIHECQVQDEVLSDHYFIQCTLKWRKPQPQRVKVTRRNYRDLNMSSFVQDVEEGLRQFPTDGSVDLQVETLSRTILEVLNKQCPLKSSLRRVCSSPPWYNTEIHEARRSKRRMERKYRKNKTDANKQLYLDEKKTFNDMLVTAKTEYFIDKLASTDPKGMFATVNTLLNKASTILPDNVSPKQLSDDFADFFSNKIKNIRKNMDNGNDSSANICSRDSISESTLSGDSLPKFDQFTSVSEDCVLELIQKMPSKSCILDPLPTWLLKDNITLFLPYLTSIVSTSLTSGVFPASYCSAVVSPIIKKHNLDKNCLQNYRPVSNLQFGAKVVEKAAISQISEHINSNNLFDPNQSAYRRQHSTETALLRVKSDIMCQIDQGNAVMLVMLDLSAAFDTIDHTILLHRLQRRFAITDTALSWITTYMTDRSSKVSINGHFSADHDLIYGVPQGSVVGPNLFVYYSYPVSEIISNHDLNYHVYADDVQIYTSFNPRVSGASDEAIDKLSSCIEEIKQWMSVNKLKLNESKTEFFIAGPSRVMKSFPDIALNIAGTEIRRSDSIRNLGVEFDACMSMSAYIASLCKSINFHLRSIARIRRFIDRATCERVICSLVTSRLDYANSLIYGINKTDLTKLQRLQNRAARLIVGASRRESALPLLKDLHWLPVR